MNTIRCEHCGADQQTPRPDLRRFCDRCRAARNALALSLRPQACRGHRGKFYPADQAHARSKFCHDCSLTPSGRNGERDGTGDTCGFCHGATRLLPGLRICYLCLQNPDDRHHALVVKALRAALDRVAA